MNNQALIFSDRSDDKVKILNTEDWAINVLVENARNIAVHPGGKQVLVHSRTSEIPGTRLFDIESDQEIAVDERCSNPVFLSDVWLAYNVLDDNNQYQIILYEVNTGERLDLGDGRIIGKSADGEKVYYVKNYQNIYHNYLPG